MDADHTVATAQMVVRGEVGWRKRHLVRQKFPLLLWKWVKAPSLLSMGEEKLGMSSEVGSLISTTPPLPRRHLLSFSPLLVEEAPGWSWADRHSSIACVTRAFTTSVRQPCPLLLMGNNKARKSGCPHSLQNCKIPHS